MGFPREFESRHCQMCVTFFFSFVRNYCFVFCYRLQCPFLQRCVKRKYTPFSIGVCSYVMVLWRRRLFITLTVHSGISSTLIMASASGESLPIVSGCFYVDMSDSNRKVVTRGVSPAKGP